MGLTVWVLAIYTFLVSFAILYELIKARFDSQWSWFLHTVLAITFVAQLFFTWRWDFFSYYLRWLLLFCLCIGIGFSYRRKRILPFVARPYSQLIWTSIGYGLLIVMFSISSISAIRGMWGPEQPIQLDFPLKQGVYYVAHGGGEMSINYHHGHPAQVYALDFVKLNRYGTRARGLTPKKLEHFMIYGEPIYSPCTGQVVSVTDGIKEQSPLKADLDSFTVQRNQAAGNSVVIRCQEAQVVLAHMVPGSIQLKKHAQVTRGQFIGKVGNSGNTSEPHLHIHAVREGKGIPIRFDRRYLIRNSVVFES